MCEFNAVHEYIEKILGRPVYTHELANAAVIEDIKERAKPDFIRLCKEGGE